MKKYMIKKYMNIAFVFFLCSWFVYIFFSNPKINSVSVEDLDIYIGAGVGINKNTKGDIDYKVSVNTNAYKEDGSVESVTYVDIGNTIGQTRDSRQKKTGKQFFLGLVKVYIIDEEYAQYGIRNNIDILFKNPVINDQAFLVMCKGHNEQYFKLERQGYGNTSEYISDMIKNSSSYNFFKEDYSLNNAELSMDAEGKNVVCPYIEMNKDEIQINGMAVLKKDKLATVLDMKDTKIMNMLRENKVKGILTIQNDYGKYVNYEAKSKRKITCSKIGDKYTFVIDLNLNGEIISNELYKDLPGKIDVTKKFEGDMEKQVKEMCNVFLDKMKKEYKVDCLQLGWVAAAKYGRDSGVDWDEVVSNSDIKVNVKVHVDKVGRGQY